MTFANTVGQKGIRATVGVWVPTLLLIGSMCEFVNVNATWLKPLGRDLWGWITAPTIAGGPTAPAGWPMAIALYAATGASAWMGTTAAFTGTELATNFIARLGVSIVLAVAGVGYAGMLAVVLGRLDPGFISLVVGAELAAAFTCWAAGNRLDRRRLRSGGVAKAISRPSGGLRPDLSWLGWTTVIGVLLFAVIHSVMSPITEIDATIYHAESARLWFLTRPDPPLIFGPSVGIEISGNYPPLFPAIGAATYAFLGNFDDLYLRIVSPVIGTAILLVTFAYARWRSGRTVAWWVVILTIGSPLLVMYMAWSTNYVLLTALSLLVLLLCELAATSGRLAVWTMAGLVAGLAVLTNFYGWVVFGFALLAGLVWGRSWRQVSGLVVFGLTAGIVASPWLIRNWILLGDPIYPLADHVFHPVGLPQPLWGATQLEIQSSALSIFGPETGLRLRTLEGVEALVSNYLLPSGLVVGLIVGAWRALERELRSVYLTGSILLVLLEILIPGWYWLRALLPLVPIGALLTGVAIEQVDTLISERQQSGLARDFAAGLWKSSLAAVAVVSFILSVALSFAGPNQETWTTSLPSTDNFMTSVRNLGSDNRQLTTAFGGDYESWEWLNARLGPNDRVASFEIRAYYIKRPTNVFYLDGIEAQPLLGLYTPDAVRSYLSANNVRYILIPAWSREQPTANLLPLMQMLGAPGGFPLSERWEDSAVYSVTNQ